MEDDCAIEARYVDHKNVPGRGVLKIILEIPVEHTTEFFNKFGHPDPGKEKRVGLALLATETDTVSLKEELAEKAEKTKRKFEDLPYSQQAALLCKDERFRYHNFRRIKDGKPYTPTEDEATEHLRIELGIESRTELDRLDNTLARTAFERIRDTFRAETGSYPEQRG